MRKPPREVFVTHGEPDTARDYARFMREKTGWNASAPVYRQEAQLE
jgi:predicted metal-dependent RNase